jgi:hypothetical protein
MRKVWLALAALLVSGSLSAAASTSPPKSYMLKTRRSVSRLAADGARVAVATTTTAENTCDRIVVWSPLKRSSVGFKTGINCETSSAINEILEIALANKRVAWIEADGGNYLDLSLRSRVLGSKKQTTTIASASNGNGAAEESSGDYVGNMFGDGGVLAFNYWSECMAIPVGWEGEQTCPDPAPGDQPITIFSGQKLLKIVNGKGVAIASAPDVVASGLHTMSLKIVAVDARRIATQRPDGSVAIYSAGVSAWKRMAVPNGTFSGFAFQGSQLATVRNGDLDLYDVDTGLLTQTIPLAAGSKLRDLQRGLAVYLRGRKIHVLRLADKKDVTYAPPGKGSVDAQIESSGLFYSYNYERGRSPGRVVFVPFAAVLKKFG